MLTWQQSDRLLTSQEIMINKNRIFNYNLLCKLGWHAFINESNGHRRYFSHSKFIIYESLRVIRSKGPRAKSFIDSIFYLMMFLIEFFVRFRNREKNINYMERNLVHARGIIRTHECMLWSHTVCVCIATRRRIPLSTLKHLCSTFFFSVFTVRMMRYTSYKSGNSSTKCKDYARIYNFFSSHGKC